MLDDYLDDLAKVIPGKHKSNKALIRHAIRHVKRLSDETRILREILDEGYIGPSQHFAGWGVNNRGTLVGLDPVLELSDEDNKAYYERNEPGAV